MEETLFAIIFVLLGCMIGLVIRLKKKSKLLNTYRNLYHSMKHDLSTPLSMLESSYEMAFGDYADDKNEACKHERIKDIKTGIDEAFNIIKKYSKKSDKLKEL